MNKNRCKQCLIQRIKDGKASVEGLTPNQFLGAWIRNMLNGRFSWCDHLPMLGETEPFRDPEKLLSNPRDAKILKDACPYYEEHVESEREVKAASEVKKVIAKRVR